ncbi:MAG: hypothetical protein AAFQ83_19170 [Bacteroidota bacterium]
MSSQSSLYKEVVNVEYLRPIRSEEQYEEVLEVIEALVFRNELSREEQDYLETLALIVERYEEAKHSIDVSPKEPLELLEFLLSENGMNGSDLGILLGNRSLGGAILRGERGLSKTHIKKLSERFRVSPALFL